jgi:hypothetical protein
MKSSGNGHQTRALIRDMESASKRLQSQIDTAVALADREVGIQHSEFSIQNSPALPNIQMPGANRGEAPLAGPRVLTPNAQPLVPSPSTPAGLPVAPTHAIPPPPQPEAISISGYTERVRAGWVPVIGLSGTPITAGFIRELGEYNPKLDGVNGIWTYQEMRRGDGQVAGTLKACKLPILSAKWQVIPLPDSQLKKGQTASKAKETADFIRENFFGGLEWQGPNGSWITQDWKEVVRCALRFQDFGAACVEEVMTVDGDRIRCRNLADRQALTFYRWHTDPHSVDASIPPFIYDDGETLYALEQWGYRSNRFEYVLLPTDKCCVFTHEQEGANFWGIPLTRAMYPHWFMKKHLERIDAIGLERNSLGIPMIMLPPNPSRQDVQTAQNWVTQLAAHEKTGLSLPNGAEFKLVGIEGHLRDIMPSLQYHKQQIAASTLAMFMELGGEKSGSRALGESQTDFFKLATQYQADYIATRIRNATVRRLCMWNFGADAPVPLLVPANVQARSIEAMSKVVAELAQQGAWISDRGSVDQIRGEMGFENFKDEDVVLARGVTMPGTNMPDDGTEKPPEATDNTDDADQPGRQKAKGGGGKAKLETGNAGSEALARVPRPESLAPALPSRDPIQPALRLSASVVKGQAKQRTADSAFWHEKVHPTQVHIDFASLHQAVATGEDRIARVLQGPARARVIASIAHQAVEQLKAGKRPSELTFAHDDALRAALLPEITRVYDAVRKATHGEIDRQWKSRFTTEAQRHGEENAQRLSASVVEPEVLATAGFQVPMKYPPELVVDGAVQDVVNRYGAAARNVANDLEADEIGSLDDDVFVNALHQLADGFIDRAAAEASRDAMRGARNDELGEAGIGEPPDADLSAICEGGDACRCVPYADLTEWPVVWRRSALLDQNTCGPCANADGSEI